ncbi:Protein DDI1 homolog 2 [Eumeta japonica]|uniref:Protein DDI1 homolog 2 n=1 Tax=Eumeta variegata TaxID=151549 RepID=A0A4C2AG38_EUMVA|nr:Protein DDI1 homolog 2 [Eumeta japonica]
MMEVASEGKDQESVNDGMPQESPNLQDSVGDDTDSTLTEVSEKSEDDFLLDYMLSEFENSIETIDDSYHRVRPTRERRAPNRYGFGGICYLENMAVKHELKCFEDNGAWDVVDISSSGTIMQCKFPVKAFIDSGAQTTIMSAACAERCNIMRLVDTRWAGIAKGVGIQRIIGRIHMVQMRIEKDFLTTSFSVLEEQPMDMLLGLDMLKRHQCTIDLKRNVLHIGTTGTETPFLPESELPECARLSGTSEEDVVQQSIKEDEERRVKEAIEQSKQKDQASRKTN